MQHAHHTAPAAATTVNVPARSTSVTAPRQLDLQTLKLVSGGATTRVALGGGPRATW